MSNNERIKQVAHERAAYYRLTLAKADGGVQTFPADAGSYYRLWESPAIPASATYLVTFYDADQKALACPSQLVPLEVPSAQTGQSSLKFSIHPTNSASPRLNTGLKSSGEEGRADNNTPERPVPEIDPELKRHLQAMEIEERQQEFIRNSTYVTEVGEQFVMNRLMRREMLEMHRIIVQHAQQAYKDIDNVKGSIQSLFALQREMTEQAMKSMMRPPAPPPDYVGLGHSALAALREIGVALIQRSPGGKSESTQKALAAAEEKSAEPARGAVLSRLAEKLNGMDDVDIALKMSTSEGWKAMLDELRQTAQDTAKDATPTAPAADAKPAPARTGTEGEGR